MNIFGQAFDWFSVSANWVGYNGIPVRVLEHLQYVVLAVGFGCLFAVPLGCFVGHTGWGKAFFVGFVNAFRALPTLGLLTFLVLLLGIGLFPPLFVLVIVAVPPLLAGVYSGIAMVDVDVVAAARSMGMKEMQIVFRVEVPNALPTMFGGLRSAFMQVIATATVAAFINLGGLGRYLTNGLALGDYGQMLGGALLVSGLAVVVDLFLAVLQRFFVSVGLRK